MVVDLHSIAVGEFSRQDFAREGILDPLLNDALERSSAELRVVAFACKCERSGLRDAELHAASIQSAAKIAQLNLRDGAKLLARERVEDHDVVDAIDELGTKALLQQVANMRFDDRLVFAFLAHFENCVRSNV